MVLWEQTNKVNVRNNRFPFLYMFIKVFNITFFFFIMIRITTFSRPQNNLYNECKGTKWKFFLVFLEHILYHKSTEMLHYLYVLKAQVVIQCHRSFLCDVLVFTEKEPIHNFSSENIAYGIFQHSWWDIYCGTRLLWIHMFISLNLRIQLYYIVLCDRQQYSHLF